MVSGSRAADERADDSLAADKESLRRQIRARRVERAESAAVSAERTARALELSSGYGAVACYFSLGSEPDTTGLIDALAGSGVRVLLPVLGRRADGSVRRDPDWAWYAGPDRLRAGFRQIPEPTTAPLGETALAEVGWIWCSALATTPDGRRLGTGGGWYDRALGFARPGSIVAALGREEEVLPELPAGPHDRRVDFIVTERRRIACAEYRSPGGR